MKIEIDGCVFWSPPSFAEKKCEIDKLAEEYITNVRNLAPDQRVEHLQKIQNGFSKCKEYSDDKVQLAMQTYEMVSAGDPRPGGNLEISGNFKCVIYMQIYILSLSKKKERSLFL